MSDEPVQPGSDFAQTERLEFLLEATSDGLYDWNIATGAVYFSPSFYAMLDYTPGDFPYTYEGWRTLVHPDDLPDVETAISRHFENPRKPYSAEFRMRTREGQWRWHLSRGRVVTQNADGSPARMVGSHTDIQDRKFVEERYRLLFENLDSAFALHEAILSPEGRLVDFRWLEANPAFERLLGFKPAEIVGHRLHEIIPNPEEQWLQPYEPVVLEGTRVRYENFSKIQERWYETSAYRPAPGQFAILIQDVTARKTAELATQRSEEQFRLLAENATDLITRHDPSGRYLWASPSMQQLTGFKPEEWVGQDSFQNIHPEDRPLVAESLESITSSQEASQVRYRHRRSDGTWFWVESIARALRDPATGSVVELQVSTRDIDSSRREALLAEETETLAKVGGWEYDLVTKTIQWTKGIRKILGFPLEGPPADFQSDRALLTPESLHKLEMAMEQLYRSGQGWDLELDRFRTDGTPITIRATCRAEVQDGRMVRLHGALQDITEQKLIKTRERELEQFYKALVDVSGGLIIVLDREGRIVRFNPACEKLTGWKEAELLHKPCFDILLPPEQREYARGVFADLASVQFPQHDEQDWLTQDGTRRWIAWVNSVILDEKGEIQYVVSMGLDQTEKRNAEQALRDLANELEQRVIERTKELSEANRELEAFSYSVSHDLRSPLRTVDGFSQILLEDFGSLLPDEGKRQVAVIRQGAQRMGNLIDDLLRFSRTGRIPLDVQTINMAALFEAAVQELGMPTPNVQLEVGVLPPCQGDAGLLKQVWINLLSNAVKYSRGRNPAVIQVGWEDTEGRQAYFVRDNGTGFDMKYADKLFKVFQRLHRQEDFEGTGVGLALVRQILVRHGGGIWAESTLGEGACFRFSVCNQVKGAAS